MLKTTYSREFSITSSADAIIGKLEQDDPNREFVRLNKKAIDRMLLYARSVPLVWGRDLDNALVTMGVDSFRVEAWWQDEVAIKLALEIRSVVVNAGCTVPVRARVEFRATVDLTKGTRVKNTVRHYVTVPARDLDVSIGTFLSDLNLRQEVI